MAQLRSGVTLDGIDNVTMKFTKFIRDTNSKARPIMQSASVILQKAAQAKAPVSKSGKQTGKWSHPAGTLKNSVCIGEVFRTRTGISAAVGIKRNQYFTQEGNLWYARWNEFGTTLRTAKNWWGHRGLKHSTGVMPERPFMRWAIRSERGKIRIFVQTRLKEALFNDGFDG